MKMKRYTTIAKRTAVSALALTALLTALPMASYAEQVNFTRTAEEWAHLQDNTLAFEEIADLIHEYNAAVITNRSELSRDERRSYDAQEISDFLADKADDYEADADRMEETSAVLAATYRSQANSLRRQADSNLDDFEVIRLGYEQIEKQTALSARQQFLAYYSALAQSGTTASNLAYLERAYHSAENRRNVNMATELEVLTAKETWETAKANAAATAQEIPANRMSLIVLCGWKYDANAEIGPLPEIDTASAAVVDFEADKAKAQAKNIGIRIDEIRLQNAQKFNYGTRVEEQKNTLKQTTDSFGISFRAAYDSLVNAAAAYNTAVLAKANGDKDLAYAEKQYGLGLISQVELEGARNTNLTLDTAVQTAYISLIGARVKYDAAVNDGIL